MFYTPGSFLGRRWFLTMYFVNMLPVLYRPALVVLSYHSGCVSFYCSILVQSGVCTVLLSDGLVLWVDSSGVLFS